MIQNVRDASIRDLAARVWSYRLRSELESAHRFRALVTDLRTLDAAPLVIRMADQAASDELRHASLCRDLIQHFGSPPPSEPAISLRRIAPPGIEGRERVLYDVVAFACVTETLSTALLGELVARARDPVCRRAMRSILRDEINHGRLGWAFLAQESARGTRDSVGPHLPAMFAATLGDDFFTAEEAPDPKWTELAGLGALELRERQRIVRETLAHVILPGLERFGVETALGRRWLASF
jgi:hypothetical protein